MGLFGEMMTTTYRALGVAAVVTNGPMRDIDAIKPLGVQYFCTGTTPAHGDMMVREVGGPVTVGGMTVMPGDMVHMDLHGVVKFPAGYREEVLVRARKLLEDEAGSAAFFKDPGFSLERWRKRSGTG